MELKARADANDRIKKDSPMSTKLTFKVSDEVLRPLAEGNEKAFKEIYKRYAFGILKIGEKYFESEKLAEDFLVEVFSNALENREKFKNSYDFNMYMMDLLLKLVTSHLIRVLEEEIKLDEEKNP